VNTEIYYFTATGNSLAVARDIAGKTKGKLISIPSVENRKNILPEADIVGIVFPVYYATNNESGIPLIVERFIGKLENIGSGYIFSVCTHGGVPGQTIENLGKLIRLRGGELSAGFTVKMGIPYSSGEKMRYAFFHKKLEIDMSSETDKQKKISADWKVKLDDIVQYINARKKGRYETRSVFKKLLIAPLIPLSKLMFNARYNKLSGSSGLPFQELIPQSDKSFRYDENCNGCGICSKVCPVGNIRIVDKKPVWQHHCETCLACFQWCPKQAICGDIVEFEKRYHHPDISLSDILKDK
jgi:ferredoxin